MIRHWLENIGIALVELGLLVYERAHGGPLDLSPHYPFECRARRFNSWNPD